VSSLANEREQFKLCMTVRRCMQDKAPQYLKEYRISFSDTDIRQRLRSASCHLLSVPRHRRTFGRRTFAVAGPTAWNSLPDDLRTLSCCDSYFGRFLKSFFVLLLLAHRAHYRFFCRAMLCISATYAVMRCLSVRVCVCVSVTFMSCVKTNKDIFEIFSPSGIATPF